MGLQIGKYSVSNIKLGNNDVIAVYLCNYKVWPIESQEDINIEDLIQILSCYCFGHWSDILPWNDRTNWVDNILIT